MRRRRNNNSPTNLYDYNNDTNHNNNMSQQSNQQEQQQQQQQQALGISNRRHGLQPPFINTNPEPTNNNNNNNNNLSPNANSPKSPIIPSISDFMIQDEDYGYKYNKKYYDGDNHYSRKGILNNSNNSNNNNNKYGRNHNIKSITDYFQFEPRQSKYQQQIPFNRHNTTNTNNQQNPYSNYNQSYPQHPSLSQQQHQQQGYNIKCAKFCTFFSIIAILFLVMVGILIEVQPLYIKGISAERVPLSLRKMREMGIGSTGSSGNGNGNGKSEKELLSFVNYSGRLRMLQSYYIHQPSSSSSSSTNRKTYDDDPITNYEKYNAFLRSLSDEQKEYIVYEMKSQAKTAFKTAALYFVIMVLSIVYTHNLDRVHLMFGVGLKVYWTKVKYLILGGGWRKFVMMVYNKYRRREYSNIPDRNSHFRSNVVAGSGGESGLNSRVITPIPSRNASFESVVGLSMREKDATNSGGSHFGQQHQQESRSEEVISLLDDYDYKPKKK